MELTGLFSSYGVPGFFVLVIAYLFLSDRKFSAERREELRKDIDRESTENDRLREVLKGKNRQIAELEETVRRLRNGEDA